MQIILTETEKLNYFYDSLCNAVGTNYMNGYGLKLDYNDKEYQASKQKLNNPCFEDVLKQMLLDGYSLTMTDVEGDDEYTSTIKIGDVYERMDLVLPEHLVAIHTESDDISTADAILQTIFFKEIIFG